MSDLSTWQWERLMEVLWAHQQRLEEMNTHLGKLVALASAKPEFTPAQTQMMRDAVVREIKDAQRPGGLLYNLEYPGDFVEKPREQGAEPGRG